MVGNNGFESCIALSRINLSNIKVLERCAFGECSSLVHLVLNNAEEFKDKCFEHCCSLVQIIAPRLKTISLSSFLNSKINLISNLANSDFKTL